MQIRHIKSGGEGAASQFNIHSMSEIIVYITKNVDEAWTDTDYMNEYEVFIKATNTWMTFREAFDGKHIITDNENTCFFEPKNEEDRKRGYTL